MNRNEKRRPLKTDGALYLIHSALCVARLPGKATHMNSNAQKASRALDTLLARMYGVPNRNVNADAWDERGNYVLPPAREIDYADTSHWTGTVYQSLRQTYQDAEAAA